LKYSESQINADEKMAQILQALSLGKVSQREETNSPLSGGWG